MPTLARSLDIPGQAIALTDPTPANPAAGSECC